MAASPTGDGWKLHGNTGTAYPRGPHGVADEGHGLGWYAGWAEKGVRTLIVVRLDRDRHPDPVPTGQRTRASLLELWPAMAAVLPQPVAGSERDHAAAR